MTLQCACGLTLPDVKYGRDHGGKITMEEIVDRVLAHADDREQFLDTLDAEFLFGAWCHFFGDEEVQVRGGKYLLMDIRGLVWEIVRRWKESVNDRT